ncbi:hypothetical protein [Streptomyces sp. NPDC050164]
MADRQFVVEAVAENRDIKTDVLRALRSTGRCSPRARPSTSWCP